MTAYPVEAAWRGALQDIRQRRASFFTYGLVAPLVFWLVVIMLARFDSDVILRALIPVVALLPIAVLSAVLLQRARRHAFAGKRQQQVIAVLHRLYYASMLLSLSAYILRAGTYYAAELTSLPYWVTPALFVLYFASAIAAGLWAPSSLPRSAEDEALAARRGARWLPWVIGAQGSLIGLGVFLGAWFMHNDVSWADLFLLGLSAFGSMFLVMLSVIGIHRFFVLATNPIPPGVEQEFGLKG